MGAKVYESGSIQLKNLVSKALKQERPISYDLQRSVLRCLLRARSDITQNCLDKITNKARHLGEFTCLPEARETFDWLWGNRKSVEAVLRKLDKSGQPEIPLQTLGEVEILVLPSSELNADQSKAIQQKLIDAITKDPKTPGIFKEEAETSFIALMHAYFSYEIKHNQVVRNIFTVQLLVQLNQSQTQVLLTLSENLRKTVNFPDVLEKLDALERNLVTLGIDMSSGFVNILSKLDELHGRFDSVDQGVNNIHLLIDTRFEELKALLKRQLENRLVGIPQNLPRSGVVEFVGRETVLQELHKQLRKPEKNTITAIRGMGGIGKTELALQYSSYHFQQTTYPGGVCWLQARAEDVGTQIVSFCRTQLDLVPPTGMDLLTQLAFCWRHWPPGDVLLVLDNVTNYRAIKPFLPPQAEPRFKVLLTTRLRLGQAVELLELPLLDAEAALRLLQVLVDDRRTEGPPETARELCRRLGYLPLALELVGRYLARDPDLSVQKVLERFEQKGLSAKAIEQAEEDMTAELGVRAAFELSWEELKKDMWATELAVLLSLFAPVQIPWELVEACLPEWDSEQLEDTRNKWLVGLSFLERLDERLYQLHPLIRQYFREKLTEFAEMEKLKRAYCRTMVSEAKGFPATPTRGQWEKFAPVVPHLVEAVGDELLQWIEDEDLQWPFVGLGLFYVGQGAYVQAEPWYRQCLEAGRTRLGEEHPFVAASLNNLAGLYQSQGHYEKAEPLYVQALEILDMRLGSAHPCTRNVWQNYTTFLETLIKEKPPALSVLRLSGSAKTKGLLN